MPTDKPSLTLKWLSCSISCATLSHLKKVFDACGITFLLLSYSSSPPVLWDVLRAQHWDAQTGESTFNPYYFTLACANHVEYEPAVSLLWKVSSNTAAWPHVIHREANKGLRFFPKRGADLSPLHPSTFPSLCSAETSKSLKWELLQLLTITESGAPQRVLLLLLSTSAWFRRHPFLYSDLSRTISTSVHFLFSKLIIRAGGDLGGVPASSDFSSPQNQPVLPSEPWKSTIPRPALFCCWCRRSCAFPTVHLQLTDWQVWITGIISLHSGSVQGHLNDAARGRVWKCRRRGGGLAPPQLPNQFEFTVCIVMASTEMRTWKGILSFPRLADRSLF